MPVVLPEAVVERDLGGDRGRPDDARSSSTWSASLVEVPAIGLDEPFPMDPSTQHRFLNGLDDVGITLAHADEIDTYEAQPPRLAPRLTPDGRRAVVPNC